MQLPFEPLFYSNMSTPFFFPSASWEDLSLSLAAVVVVLGYFGARYWRGRSLLIYFFVQIIAYTVLTCLMTSAGVVPYSGEVAAVSPSRRLLIGALDAAWWLGAGWVAVGFLRAFVVLGRRPRESKLIQDLIAALIYVAVAFAIITYVFNLPVRGLLATSGALAIVIGLALQSSLGDVFSGLVLNFERPYQVGDSIILDDVVQGTVIETNWRATHILTGNNDVAIVPNSMIARSRLVNCSTPTRLHGTNLRVRLDPTLTPVAGCKVLQDALLGSARILRSPEATVTVKDISAEATEYELTFCVPDIKDVDAAQNELFDAIHRAVFAAGSRFAPRLPGLSAGPPAPTVSGEASVPERLLAGVPLFAALREEEKAALAAQMKRRDYISGDLIADAGAISQVFSIVSDGVIVELQDHLGAEKEHQRLSPGSYFGEAGLLMGDPLQGKIRALTPAVIYEISRDAFCPLLAKRPGLAEELSEALARQHLENRATADAAGVAEAHKQRLVAHIAASIRHLFALH
jgi:small-conductance mechanosensitive channel/CRP-like cAMP-binding protein